MPSGWPWEVKMLANVAEVVETVSLIEVLVEMTLLMSERVGTGDEELTKDPSEE